MDAAHNVILVGPITIGLHNTQIHFAFLLLKASLHHYRVHFCTTLHFLGRIWPTLSSKWKVKSVVLHEKSSKSLNQIRSAGCEGAHISSFYENKERALGSMETRNPFLRLAPFFQGY